MSPHRQQAGTPLLYRGTKRLLDIVLSAPLLLLALPGLMLYLRQGHPLKKQAFVGQAGAICYQYTIGAERQFNRRQLFLLKICRVQQALQLLPVLTGAMTIIGPRPCAPKDFRNLPDAIQQTPGKPGLIGLWWLAQHGYLDRNSTLASINESVPSLRAEGKILLHALRARCAAAQDNPPDSTAACTRSAKRYVDLAASDLIPAVMAALAQKLPTKITCMDRKSAELADTDQDFQHCLQQMDWVCADGLDANSPIIPTQSAIADLLPELCKQLATHRYSVYLLAAKPGLAGQMAIWMMLRYPYLRIAGMYSGHSADADNRQILDEIYAARTDVVLLALDAPQQENWLLNHLAASGATVGIGVNQLFEIYAARMQASGPG